MLCVVGEKLTGEEERLPRSLLHRILLSLLYQENCLCSMLWLPIQLITVQAILGGIQQPAVSYIDSLWDGGVEWRHSSRPGKVTLGDCTPIHSTRFYSFGEASCSRPNLSHWVKGECNLCVFPTPGEYLSLVKALCPRGSFKALTTDKILWWWPAIRRNRAGDLPSIPATFSDNGPATNHWFHALDGKSNSQRSRICSTTSWEK